MPAPPPVRATRGSSRAGGEDPRHPGRDLPRGRHRAEAPQRVRAGGGDDPLRPVHRRAGEPGDPGAPSPAIRRRRRWRRRAPPRSKRSSGRPASTARRPRTSSAAPGARRARWCRSAHDGGHGQAARRGTQDESSVVIDTRLRHRRRHRGRHPRPAGVESPGDRARGRPDRGRAPAHGLIPRERWIKTTDLLIFHGRRICQARRPRLRPLPGLRPCRWPHRQAYALGESRSRARAHAR